jgi:subtilisin family serine protease
LEKGGTGIVKLKKGSGSFLVFFLILSILSEPAPTLISEEMKASGSTTRVYVDPPLIRMEVCENFTVNINVQNVTDLHAWEIGMQWDVSILECFTFTYNYSFFGPADDVVTIPGVINNTAGKIDPPYVAAITTLAGVSGKGTLADVTFHVKHFGETWLNLTVTLANSAAEEIPSDVINGYFCLETYVPGELIVWFDDNATQVEIDDAITRLETEAKTSSTPIGDSMSLLADQYNYSLLEPVPKFCLLTIVGNRTVEETADLFKAETIVTGVEPNYIMPTRQVHQLYPDDPGFPSQWSLLNGGQTSGTIDADIDMPQAWSLIDQYNLWRNGDPVVAVIDSGADIPWPAGGVPGHPDLVPNLWLNPSEATGTTALDDDGNGYIDDIYGFDCNEALMIAPLVYRDVGPDGVNGTADDDDGPRDFNGHGTHVAGIIGAVGNNGRDIAGVNWHAELMIVKARSRSDYLFGMLYTTWMKFLSILGLGGANIRVINASWGWYTWGPALVPPPHRRFGLPLWSATDALIERQIRFAGNLDILFVSAAGYGVDLNGDGDVNDAGELDDDALLARGIRDFPTVLPLDNIITVTASNDLDQWVGWAAYGAATVDLAAPGDNIVSLGFNSRYLEDEWIYRDVDSSGTVSIGDIRLVAVEIGSVTYAAGSVVARGDLDVGYGLAAFDPSERHDEFTPANGRFDSGEFVYRDVDSSGTVTSGDVRLATISRTLRYGSTVRAADPDVGNVLAPFAANELHVVVWSASGTSMAAPHVSGVASLAFAMFPSKSALNVKNDILFGAVGPEPASGVDRKTWLIGPPKMLVSDGRLRWPYTGDLGDAPHQFYGTIAREITLPGPLHWDNGNEWFGSDDNGRVFDLSVTNEVDADWWPPYDQDATPNIIPFPNLDMHDHPNPPNFWFSPPPPWTPGQIVQVFYFVSTNYLGVNDAEGGRYQPLPNRMIYVNGFFDWDWSDTFDIPPEHSVHQPHDLSAIVPPGNTPAVSPPTTHILLFSSTFIAQSPVPKWIRFRLDYGEDVGAVSPDVPHPGFLPDQVLPVWEHLMRARFGEVEDFRMYMCLDAEPPTLIDLSMPVSTEWLELTPIYNKMYLLEDWHDANSDDMLDPSDYIMLWDEDMIETVPPHRWYINDITVTLKVKPSADETIYIECEGGWALYDTVILEPVSTQWLEVYPDYRTPYNLSIWEDSDGDGVLSPSDQIELIDKETGDPAWCYVEEVKTDLIVTLHPKPVIESSDYSGIKKDDFDMEPIYMFGFGYAPNTTYSIYVVENTTWTESMAIPTSVPGTAPIVTANGTGQIPPTEIWTSAFMGTYDVIIDMNNDGFYNALIDILDDNDVNGAGFVVSPIHDVAVTDVTPLKTAVGQGFPCDINVTITNEGDLMEAFSTTAYADLIESIGDKITIGTMTIILDPGDSTTITFTWNTTDMAESTYIISAYAGPVPDETEVSDNSFSDGWIVITIPGDVDGDFDVDIYDVVKMCSCYGTEEGDDRYVANCDTDCDGDIDIYDIVIMCSHYGEAHP